MTYLNCLFCNSGYRAMLLNHCTWRIFWSSQSNVKALKWWEQNQDVSISSSLYHLKHIIKLTEGHSSPWNSEMYMGFFSSFYWPGSLTSPNDHIPSLPHLMKSFLTLSWWNLISTFIFVYSHPQWMEAPFATCHGSSSPSQWTKPQTE